MTIDLKAMLERVVADVFDEDFTVEDDTAPGDALRPAVLVTSHLVEGRTAVIRATYTFLECFIPELDVQAAILDDDDVEAEKEVALRRVCVAMRAYLWGEGRIEPRRRWFRPGTTNVLYLDIAGGRPWRLGRNFYSVGDPR